MTKLVFNYLKIFSPYCSIKIDPLHNGNAKITKYHINSFLYFADTNGIIHTLNVPHIYYRSHVLNVHT